MMPATTMNLGVAKLAPSELVLLNGDRFAGKSRIGNVKLPQNGATVSAGDLGQIILAAALLACEKASVIRLEVRKKKTLLGLRKVDALFVEPLTKKDNWPKHSFESEIYSLAVRLKNEKGNNEVENIIYEWLGENSGSPWQRAVELVQSGLADRGALARIQERRMKVLKTTSYKMTVSTARQAAEQPLDPIIRLLEECQHIRPYVWQLLISGMKSAMNSRTEFYSNIDID
ncbi:MAG: hypothetical protein PVH03_05025 [Chloroflexota bacterium]|jgi:hypothetical protein